MSITHFNRAVDKAEAALESTPFPLPPDLPAALEAISALVETINASVIELFPDLLLPPGVAVEVWNRAVDRVNSKRQKQGPSTGSGLLPT